jgi:hypothetical protein
VNGTLACRVAHPLRLLQKGGHSGLSTQPWALRRRVTGSWGGTQGFGKNALPGLWLLEGKGILRLRKPIQNANRFAALRKTGPAGSNSVLSSRAEHKVRKAVMRGRGTSHVLLSLGVSCPKESGLQIFQRISDMSVGRLD